MGQKKGEWRRRKDNGDSKVAGPLGKNDPKPNNTALRIALDFSTPTFPCVQAFVFRLAPVRSVFTANLGSRVLRPEGVLSSSAAPFASHAP